MQMKNVGTIPITGKPIQSNSIREGNEWDGYPWPMYITAGDISRNGKTIILRTYDGTYQFKYM